MANRDRDWFDQALRDLEQAEDSLSAGRHEWACFAAQQSTEKAVTALHLHLGQLGTMVPETLKFCIVDHLIIVGRAGDRVTGRAVGTVQRSAGPGRSPQVQVIQVRGILHEC